MATNTSQRKLNMNSLTTSSFDALRETAAHARKDFLSGKLVDPIAVNRFVYGPHGGGSAARAELVAKWALSIHGSSAGMAFWKVVEEQWPSFDCIPHGDYERLFARFAGQWVQSPTVATLPETFVVYRGQSEEDPVGLSWTLHWATAERFARGHRGILVPSPRVYEARIHRGDVAMAFLAERGEQEVVLWSPPSRRR